MQFKGHSSVTFNSCVATIARMALFYSSGLRLGKVSTLKIGDIDSSRMLIHLIKAKGDKERCTILSPVTLDLLRIYYRLYKPKEWLFEGRSSRNAISKRTVQEIFKQAFNIYFFVICRLNPKSLGEYIDKNKQQMEVYITTETISTRVKHWLKQIEPFNRHLMTLSIEKSALMIIDMQKFFLDTESPTFTCGGLAILPNLKRIIEAFRKAGRPVIYTRHVHHPGRIDAGIMGWWWEGMCLEGSPESDVHDEITPMTNEKVILKHRYSAFYNTDLETILRCLKIEDLVISGIMTNMCCESTARDAYYRDFRVFFLADGTGSINEEMHLASLLNLSFGFSYVTDVDSIISQIVK